MTLSRRSFLGHGLGSLVLAACTPRALAGPSDAAPTPHVDDGDPAPACEPTADNIEGPFYKRGAPSRVRLAGDRDPGERLILSGTVRDTRCAPVPRAVLDVWHADARGDYDNDGWGHRGTLVTDAQGRWSLRSIVPGRYLNGRRYRPSHVHVKLRAKGHGELTTQLYFADDPYLAGDPFVVDSLVVPHRSEGGIRRAAFDFVLG